MSESRARGHLRQAQDQLRDIERELTTEAVTNLGDAMRLCQRVRAMVHQARDALDYFTVTEKTALVEGVECALSQVDSAMSERPEYEAADGAQPGYRNITIRLEAAAAIVSSVLEQTEQAADHRG